MTRQIIINQVETRAIDTLRDLYRQEMNCQIVHDSYHRRGFTTPFMILVNGRVAGYATVTNGSHRAVPAGTVTEAYLLPLYRGLSDPIFRQLLVASGALRIEAQTNDTFLTLMLFDFAEEITSDTILFHDALTTNLSIPNAIFRKATADDTGSVFEHTHEPVGDWLLESTGNVVATGGFLTHYNPPYGDLYMEVMEPHRRRGYGSYLVQELKRVCYEAGRQPTARCNATNVASRKTLGRAGLLPCARILVGRVGRNTRHKR